MVKTDAVVLGGGFFGCKIALALRGLGMSVILLEPSAILSGATAANQGRVHHGFHYPRFRETALSASKYYYRFLADHAPTIEANKRHLYAIAEGSKTPAAQFEQVMESIGAPLTRIVTPDLFTSRMVEQVYEVEEVTFNMKKLHSFVLDQLRVAGVERRQASGKIYRVDEKTVVVLSGRETIHASYCFNCTYSAIDSTYPLRTRIKKEFTEVALFNIKDKELAETDITIMDGPYWSLMRFPSHDCHALTHVTHTPHFEWYPPDLSPLALTEKTNNQLMLDDASRFVPRITQCSEYIGSRYTTRVVLASNEEDDGRPILWEYSKLSPRIISVLGSKFNSIYDAVAKIEQGEWVHDRGKTGVLAVGRRALVGFTGFVGSNLDVPGRFTDRANTSKPLAPGRYDLIVCAAPSAEKWRANACPDVDSHEIGKLQQMLENVTADEFILISTIDVLGDQGHYGTNRRMLEQWLKKRFEKLRIVRLPALFGKGLKKNALFDLIQNRRLLFPLKLMIHPESTYQWYPVSRLWQDIETLRGESVREVNLVTPPIKMDWILDLFPHFSISKEARRVEYNVTDHRGYVMTIDEVKKELQTFVEASWT